MNPANWIKWDKCDYYPEFDQPGFEPVKIRKMSASLEVKKGIKKLTDPMAYISAAASSPQLTQEETKLVLQEYNWPKWLFLKNGNGGYLDPGKKSELAENLEEPRQEMVLSNIRYVMSVAEHYSKRGGSKPDLISEGLIGLIVAIDRYKNNHNGSSVPFLSYASILVTRTIIGCMCNDERVIRIPQEARNKLYKIKKELNSFLDLHGREPTPEELAKSVDLSENKIEQLLTANQNVISLDAQINGDEDFSLIDLIEDEKESKEAIIRDILKKEVGALVSPYNLEEALNAFDIFSRLMSNKSEGKKLKGAYVIYSYYFENKTLQEIGDTLNVTREMVRQIRDKALEKIGVQTGIMNKIRLYSG